MKKQQHLQRFSNNSDTNSSSSITSTTKKRKERVAFIHPDLGIGGAERLVVDAAVGIQKYGHDVFMFTSHHEKQRCFPETIDGTLKNGVGVYGDFIPRTLFGKGHILFSTLRMLYVALRVALLHTFSSSPFSVYFVDQVSTIILFLKVYFALLWAVTLGRYQQPRVLFYCHFPDKLLSVHNQAEIEKFLSKASVPSVPATSGSGGGSSGGNSGGGAKRVMSQVYRRVFNYLEELTTGMADEVMVNSNFTKRIFYASFPSLSKVNVTTVYPAINLESYDKEPTKEQLHQSKVYQTFFSKEKLVVLTSINRFERKKNIALAVETFVELKKRNVQHFDKYRLILAGGYDSRLKENREYFEELEQQCRENGVLEQCVFLPSFTDADRYLLLHYSDCILYTPQNEHFGIVPIESQYCGRITIACNSGGPLESIENNVSGYLVEPTASAFAEKVSQVLRQDEASVTKMRETARQRVFHLFSLESMAFKLNQLLSSSG